jgi:hypothetical protein
MFAERYRRYAEECMALPATSGTSGSRWAFLQMEMLWNALARQAASNDRATSIQQQQQPQKTEKDT